MTQRHNTTLDTHTVATLRAYGGGNLSQGIRRAAELVRQWEDATGVKRGAGDEREEQARRAAIAEARGETP